jgi:imidazolonepropionase-like amidohydrolase
VEAAALALLLAACGTGRPTDTDPERDEVAATAITVRLAGAVRTVTLDGDRIASVTPAAPGAAVEGFIAPSVIDSHVHLEIMPMASVLMNTGFAAVVDLAAPVRSLGTTPPIHRVASGPMLTSPGGYPLSSWGAEGYGIGCGDAACVEATIADLAGRGARVIKLAIARDGLDPALVPIAVAAAHARGLRVAAHALGDPEAALAAAAGCDLLAHTPIGALREATVTAWRNRAVISTLAAFGGSDLAVDNLRRLRAAGATILYGTDLGNLRDLQPSADEITLLGDAGLDGRAIVDAMTAVPAAYWGFDQLGAIAPGKEASFVVLVEDPTRVPTAYASPAHVWLRGRERGPR